MAFTSLWEIDENWNGFQYKKYDNALLFVPKIWDILMCKYIDSEERENIENCITWISRNRIRNLSKLNNRINNSLDQVDRIMWEISLLSVFNKKDSQFVAKCIIDFVEKYTLTDRVRERFLGIANDIKNLQKHCKYFVIDGSSINANVEQWFSNCRLSSWTTKVCEFTIINDNMIVGYEDNLSMCR